MDSNPYKSPPPELLAEGISTVMQYVRVRMQRIDLMYKLILERCEQLDEGSQAQAPSRRRDARYETVGGNGPRVKLWCVVVVVGAPVFSF